MTGIQQICNAFCLPAWYAWTGHAPFVPAFHLDRMRTKRLWQAGFPSAEDVLK